ncbi:hypothetical protein CYMTET_36072, partial [Cymbomonas tetramitiformis]
QQQQLLGKLWSTSGIGKTNWDDESEDEEEEEEEKEEEEEESSDDEAAIGLGTGVNLRGNEAQEIWRGETRLDDKEEEEEDDDDEANDDQEEEEDDDDEAEANDDQEEEEDDDDDDSDEDERDDGQEEDCDDNTKEEIKEEVAREVDEEEGEDEDADEHSDAGVARGWGEQKQGIAQALQSELCHGTSKLEPMWRSQRLPSRDRAAMQALEVLSGPGLGAQQRLLESPTKPVGSGGGARASLVPPLEAHSLKALSMEHSEDCYFSVAGSSTGRSGSSLGSMEESLVSDSSVAANQASMMASAQRGASKGGSGSWDEESTWQAEEGDLNGLPSTEDFYSIR